MNMARISLGRSLAFAAPALPIAWLIPPVYAILGDFYLRHTAATAAGIGTAMILSKLIDAVTDLPVGYLSDHTRSPMGARKPWMLGGMCVAMLAFAMLFFPPADAGDLYFTLNIILYYLAITFIFIPYRAWLGELTEGYAERSRLWSYVTMGLLIGGLIFMLLPVILAMPQIAYFKSAEFDPDVMAFLGWTGIVAMPVFMLPALLFVPAGRRNPGHPPHIRAFVDILTASAPYRVFLAGCAASGLGFGVFYSVIIVALSSYFGIASQVALFLLIVTLVQVLSIPVWERVGARWSKHRTWAVAWAAHALIALALLFVDPSAQPFWPLVAIGVVTSILQAPHMLFPVAIVNDIVDHDTLRTGSSRSGTFMAFYTFVDKVMHAVGFGIGYYLLAAFGYDPKAQMHDDWGVTGLMLAVVGVPSLCFIVAAVILYRFPIDGRRHALIRRRIAQRIARAS